LYNCGPDQLIGDQIFSVMEPEVLSRIIQALDIIHSPFASNEIRLEAHQYCNSIKDNPNAPIFGHLLALKENGQSDVVRHFGLQLLENAIRYKWIDGIYGGSEREQIKQAIINLVQKVSINSYCSFALD
ncbi:10547_t:CDS:2, partial [Racocetra persica]